MKRLDRNLVEKSSGAPVTLKKAGIMDRAQLIVELKGENDENEPEEDTAVKGESKKEAEINVDDTEDIRTVLVNMEGEKDNVERYNVFLYWTVREMLDVLLQNLGMDPKREEFRLRRLVDNSLFLQEEMSYVLSNIPDHVEGGVRLQVERGRVPTGEEITIDVAMFKEEVVKRFYFSKDGTLGEGKQEICSEFGVDRATHQLWRVDYLEEPAYPCRREKLAWDKNHVSSGQLLILKANDVVLASEVVILHVHVTSSGLSHDCKYLDHIQVSENNTMDDLREVILQMPEFDQYKEYSVNRLRVRER